MSLQSQDIIRRSATNSLTPAPRVRDHQQEVAKLIDVTTCIGCKACQVACSEWNDIRDEIGHNVGVYDNPAISPTITFWKGIWKPLAAIGFAATFAASIFHYVGIGPNRVSKEEEESALKDMEADKANHEEVKK
ncbi:formate dehydrogenase N subunit beta transmembrane domain-containing protein [Xenorhabdus sp. IM139775]|uniref:formate dehydrogenase N subunit beta transmembrane domain-containing protein n=1 Tax=Xenorhabdus sp. IM139775 TaxID=3025876 RepID=UPI002358E65C|nr:formate dehydrogenase N subunit beta transmembrane domain-containing protein [Xenorhabdus sp. IM139775]MDC9593887.1 formate dehydrogenase N subunit beta transmembrane domain-containing protein [Xenorhabdus sp. IM139775]